MYYSYTSRLAPDHVKTLFSLGLIDAPTYDAVAEKVGEEVKFSLIVEFLTFEAMNAQPLFYRVWRTSLAV